LLVASKAFARSNLSFRTISRRSIRNRRFGRRISRNDETTASAAADLPAFTTRVPRFVGRPLMGGALFVGCAAAFAGDLPLLFSGHRCEPAPFFAF
jgi:hypothetical protein